MLPLCMFGLMHTNSLAFVVHFLMLLPLFQLRKKAVRPPGDEQMESFASATKGAVVVKHIACAVPL